MIDLNRFVQDVRSSDASDPRLLWLDDWRAAHPGQEVKVRFERLWDGYVFGPASLTLVLPSIGGALPPPPHREPWDRAYDDGLIERGVRAQDTKQEAARLTLGLIKDLEPIEIRVGNDFFRYLFVHVLRRSQLATLGPVRDMLEKVHSLEPHVGASTADRMSEVERVLAARGQRLTRALGYSPAEALDILGHALALDLDERFRVSLRDRLGMR